MAAANNPYQLLATYNRLLECVNQAVQILMAEGDDFEDAITRVLAIFGAGAGSDCVYVWNIQRHPEKDDGRLYTTKLYEWLLDAESRPQSAAMINVPVDDVIPSWMDALRQGRCIRTQVKKLENQPEYTWLEPRGVLSIMIIPIKFHGALWGFIGFEDSRRAHTWTDAEQNVFRIAGTLAGVAIHKQLINESLSKKKAELEHESVKLVQALDNFKTLSTMAGEPPYPME